MVVARATEARDPLLHLLQQESPGVSPVPRLLPAGLPHKEEEEQEKEQEQEQGQEEGQLSRQQKHKPITTSKWAEKDQCLVKCKHNKLWSKQQHQRYQSSQT